MVLLSALILTLVFTLPARSGSRRADSSGSATPLVPGESPAETEEGTHSRRLSVDSLLSDNRFREVYERSNQALLKDPFSPYWLKLRGLSLYQLATLPTETEKDPDEISSGLNQAISDFTLSLALSPNDDFEMIHILLGKCYFAKGSFFMDSCVRSFRLALDRMEGKHSSFSHSEKEANRKMILYYLGCAYAEMEAYSKSIEIFSQIEGESKSKLHTAVSYYHQKEYAKATECLQELIQSAADVNIKNSCSHWMATILVEEGRFEEAIHLYESLIRQFPNAPEPLYHLGMIHYQMNNKVKARAFFRLAAGKETPYPKANEALMSFF